MFDILMAVPPVLILILISLAWLMCRLVVTISLEKGE